MEQVFNICNNEFYVCVYPVISIKYCKQSTRVKELFQQPEIFYAKNVDKWLAQNFFVLSDPYIVNWKQ